MEYESHFGIRIPLPFCLFRNEKNYRDLNFLFADKISTSDEEKSKSCVNKSIFFFLQSNSISLSLKSSFVAVSIESKSSLEKDSLVIWNIFKILFFMIL